METMYVMLLVCCRNTSLAVAVMQFKHARCFPKQICGVHHRIKMFVKARSLASCIRPRLQVLKLGRT